MTSKNDVIVEYEKASKTLSKIMDGAIELAKSMQTLKQKISSMKDAATAPPQNKLKPESKPKLLKQRKQPAQVLYEDILVCRRVKKDAKTQELKEPVNIQNWSSMVLIPCKRSTLNKESIMFIGQVMLEATVEAMSGRETVFVYRASVPKNALVPYRSMNFVSGGTKSKNVSVSTKRFMSSPSKNDTNKVEEVNVISTLTLREFIEKNAKAFQSFLTSESLFQNSAKLGSEDHTRAIMLGIMSFAKK